MRRAIIAQPMLQNDFVAKLVTQCRGNIGPDHGLQNLLKPATGHEQSAA